MTHTPLTAAPSRRPKIVGAVTVAAIVLAVVEGVSGGTASSVVQYLSSLLDPIHQSTQSTAVDPNKQFTEGKSTGGSHSANGGGSATVSLDSPAGTSASLVIANLGMLAASKDVHYNFGSAIDASDTSCVESVTVTGLPGGQATLYAEGLPKGLLAAEGLPPQMSESGVAHQQLVRLTPRALGNILRVGATLVSKGKTYQLGTADLRVISLEAGVATLSTQGQEVTCTV